MENNKQGKRRGRALLLALLAVLVVGLATVGAAAADIYGAFGGGAVTVTIPQGAGVREIAEILKQGGVIRSTTVFRLYFRYLSKGNIFQYGSYELERGMPYDDIAKALREISALQTTARLTFPEGYTIFQIADLLEQHGVCDRDAFLALCRSGEGLREKYDFLADVEMSPLRYSLLEGYLFPDTYDFFFDISPEEVIDKMLQNFDKKFTAEMRRRAADMGYTVDEVVTLASIIEREVGGIVAEEPTVASVFQNRLESGDAYPKLESDVTKFYVRDVIPEATGETVSQAMFDAYNTYTCVGIPVGPISCPGINTLEAVLSPADSPYYYFVTDIYKRFYYGRTLAEHNQNVRTAFAVK